MTADKPFNWNPPALSIEDEKLVAAYLRVEKSLDDLPYTPQFDEICKVMGIQTDDLDGKHGVYKRLLTLRKQARLPRLYSSTS